jgi:hypothetical protein
LTVCSTSVFVFLFFSRNFISYQAMTKVSAPISVSINEHFQSAHKAAGLRITAYQDTRIYLWHLCLLRHLCQFTVKWARIIKNWNFLDPVFSPTPTNSSCMWTGLHLLSQQSSSFMGITKLTLLLTGKYPEFIIPILSNKASKIISTKILNGCDSHKKMTMPRGLN